MRISIILISLLITLCGVTASIEIEAPILDIRLGESIYADISITHDETTFGFVTAILNCDEKIQEVMREQVETIANTRTTIPFMHIVTGISETTECRLQANFLNNEGSEVYSDQTSRFLVENRLNATITIPQKELKPSDVLTITAIIHEDEKHQSGTATILFNRQTTRHTVQENRDITYSIPKNTRPGAHGVVVTITDRFGNTYETTEIISIQSVPSNIVIQTPQERYYANQPDETMNVTVTLYDQAGNIYNEELTITIKDPENKSIMQKKVQSGEYIEYVFSNTTKPGIYSIHANHESIENKITVNVLNSIYQQIEYREEQQENTPLETDFNETTQETLESKETPKEKTTTRLRKNIQNGAGIIILALIIIIALSIYNKKQKNKQNPKSNEFFNFEKKKNTRNKHKIKRVIKADPYEHDED